MENRKSNQRNQPLVAAIASVGLVGLGIAQVDASLVIDLRIISATGSNNFTSGNNSIEIGNPDGRTVTIGVYARVSGTNTVQHVIDINDDGSLLVTTNDETMQTMVGAFASTGGVKGNMGAITSPGPNAQYNPSFQPFGGSGMTNGVFQDFDSDGDLDLGATGTDPTNMWAVRTNGPATAAVASDGTHGYYSGGVYTVNSQDTVIDATTMELRIGTIRFVPTAAVFPSASTVQFVPRQNGEAGGLWFEDGIATGKNATNSPFGLGPPVNVTFEGPEPTSTSLLGLVSLGLLARRRSRA